MGSRALLGQRGVLLPKQYQSIAGRPLVAHTVAALAQVGRLHATVVVVAPGDDHAQAALSGLPARIARCGGATRADSVLQGLSHLQQAEGAHDDDWVLVHDAARCLLLPAQVDRLIDACLGDPVGGLLALPLPDTLKRAEHGRVQETQPRADKWLAQTPQMFRLGLLQRALREAPALGADVTDEASALEALGLAPRLVEGSAQNFKVTYAADFELAEAVLGWRAGRA
ncbi:MAG: 2-C-methyl-D-erythritol 4-phosphate cytidylyltransferase [Paracidovorax wautersii]|uniref:2-C-methyl-D-erythritol 4-phosphate cytidylyltransferase n=1 Tax=Paracidovorax wautersii TaxID=1177982 RepID=A0A7V8FR23_9BURK|nr:MAG: 2-C-methyl-D-erythritol 4-phosphate cytidylyltransferase [Paracidovorax wautersii]